MSDQVVSVNITAGKIFNLSKRKKWFSSPFGNSYLYKKVLAIS